jgi:hypothetical protein
MRPINSFARSGAVFTVTSRKVRWGMVSVMVGGVDVVTGAYICERSVVQAG